MLAITDQSQFYRYSEKYYNELCTTVSDCLHKNKLLINKKFGFQVKNLTKHALLQLINDITNRFEKSEFTLDVFINL